MRFLDRVITRYVRGTLASHYRDTFKTPSGLIVLADLFGKAGVMKTMAGFTSEQLQYETGKRDMVLYISAMIGIKQDELQSHADLRAIDNPE